MVVPVFRKEVQEEVVEPDDMAAAAAADDDFKGKANDDDDDDDDSGGGGGDGCNGRATCKLLKHRLARLVAVADVMAMAVTGSIGTISWLL